MGLNLERYKYYFYDLYDILKPIKDNLDYYVYDTSVDIPLISRETFFKIFNDYTYDTLIKKGENEYEILFLVPGFKKDEIRLEFDSKNRRIVLKAEQKIEHSHTCCKDKSKDESKEEQHNEKSMVRKKELVLKLPEDLILNPENLESNIDTSLEYGILKVKIKSLQNEAIKNIIIK